MLKIGVLASGRGSNFQAIIDSIKNGYLNAEVILLVTDNRDAYAIQRARDNNIADLFLEPADFKDKESYYRRIADELLTRGVELVILAGFMRLVGKPLIDAFPLRIMNIHPALLPSFKGLHGQRDALAYGTKISGCTVHFVDEGMDTGPIIAQAAVPVYSDDREESLSARILKEEHKIFPYAIRLFSEGRLRVQGRSVFIEGETGKETCLISPELT